MPYPDSNASFQALTLLGTFFGTDAQILSELWDELCGVLRESNETIRFRDDGWEQDWLLAKYGAEGPTGARAWYDPPTDFHSFPTFNIDIHTLYLADRPGITVRETRNNTDVAELFARTATSFAGPMVLDDFYELHAKVRTQGDAAMKQLNHTLAWFNVGLGKLFGGVVLSKEFDPHTALGVMQQRWGKGWAQRDVYEDYMSVPELLQWKLDVFYGAEMDAGGMTFQPARQGQPWRWQQYWQWLGTGIDPQLAVEATRLAAQLMICPPVLMFLKAMLRGGGGIKPLDCLLALAILRRLSLQLQVMAWFEHALNHSFADTRVEDLASFAFSALRPHWPRRLLALSHRSRDVKPALMQLQAWGNFRYSIDALFVPHWETNVGTVWGLFSAVPGLVRIPSTHYDDSEWCRREHEIFDYLCEEDDFLRGRRVVELEASQLFLLDAQLPPGAADAEVGFSKPGEFPPWTTVFIVYPFEAWECRLLACAAIVRMLFLQVRKAVDTAVICHLLSQGQLPSAPPLTNHPDGWVPIAALLRDFAQEWSDNPNVFPMVIDEEQYTLDDIKRDVDCARMLIDLSDGRIDQPAAFAALEWNRTIVPAQIGNFKYGQFFAIDYRRIDPERWRSDEYMVIRGVNRVHTAAPVWILQRADQRVDEWPGIGTNPIFTQHVENQWRWMGELLDEVGWPESYRTTSKLVFAPKLAAACAATKTRGAEYYRGKVS
jgi:hypothetical protein